MDKTSAINCIMAVIIMLGLTLCFISGCHEREYIDKTETGKVVASYQAAGRYYTIVVEKADGERITSHQTATHYIPVVGDNVEIRYFKQDGRLVSEVGRQR